MTRKLASIDDYSMGDLSSIIGRGPVADLSWLAVDEDQYRKDSAVPHQNLDMIPELTKALTEGKEGVPERLPYKDINLTNVNPLSNPVEVFTSKEELIRKTAFYIYKGMSDSDIESRLSMEFGRSAVAANKEHISAITAEKGLLGNVYIDADHFPKCVDHKITKEFVKRYASKSLYIVQRSKCVGCVKNVQGRCASLGRNLVEQIPYDVELLNHYKDDLVQTGRYASVAGDVKATLAMSFITPESKPNRDGGISLWTQKKVSKPTVTEADVESYIKRASVTSPEVSLEFLAAIKKLSLGKVDEESLKLSSDPQIRRLADYGRLIGTYIFDMDALGGCSKTASLLKEKGISKGLYLIRRNAKCTHCQCAKGGTCDRLSHSFKIVSSLPSITLEDYERVVLDKIASRSLTHEEGAEAIKRFAGCSEDARLKVVSRTASLTQPLTERRDYGYKPEKVYTGGEVTEIPYDSKEMATFISTKMNEGLHGQDLARVASNRYSSEQLARFAKEKPDLIEVDGVQGFYFLDPTVYRDFGRGCKIGSAKFRGRGASMVRKAASCDGCVKQTSPNWCSSYGKPLLATVTSEDLRKHNRKVSLPVVASQPEKDIADLYELRPVMEVDLGKPRRKWDPKI